MKLTNEDKEIIRQLRDERLKLQKEKEEKLKEADEIQKLIYGLSTAKVARKFGVSWSLVQKVESGKC